MKCDGINQRANTVRAREKYFSTTRTCLAINQNHNKRSKQEGFYLKGTTDKRILCKLSKH